MSELLTFTEAKVLRELSRRVQVDQEAIEFNCSDIDTACGLEAGNTGGAIFGLRDQGKIEIIRWEDTCEVRVIEPIEEITLNRRRRFVKKLAEFLVKDQARKSIELGMNKSSAVEWSELRNTTPLMGYPTVEEAEETLAKWLLG